MCVTCLFCWRSTVFCRKHKYINRAPSFPTCRHRSIRMKSSTATRWDITFRRQRQKLEGEGGVTNNIALPFTNFDWLVDWLNRCLPCVVQRPRNLRRWAVPLRSRLGRSGMRSAIHRIRFALHHLFHSVRSSRQMSQWAVSVRRWLHGRFLWNV